MTRNLKALGLALIAAFAFSSVAASAASAQGSFTADQTPVTLTGKQGNPVDEFTTTAGALRCTSTTYHAHVTTSPTTAITASPTYGSCHVAGIIPATIHMNTCGYNLTIDPKSATTEGWVDVECSNPGDSITITVGSPTVRCTIHVPEQTVSGITYTNTGVGTTKEVDIDIGASGLTYTETKGTGLGACATSTLQHNGTYTGTALVTGENPVTKAHIGIDIG